jgi:hypothetical protein
MLLKYPITDAQYQRFQHKTNDAEIRALCERAGCQVTGEQRVDGVETWYFDGRCKGTMALVPCNLIDISPNKDRTRFESVAVKDGKPFSVWECWIQVRSKPWWLPWFVLDWGFRQALA